MRGQIKGFDRSSNQLRTYHCQSPPTSGQAMGGDLLRFVCLFCPQGWGSCPRIFTGFEIPIQNVGDMQHKIVSRVGNLLNGSGKSPIIPTHARPGVGGAGK